MSNTLVKAVYKADYFNEQLPPDQSEASCNSTNRKLCLLSLFLYLFLAIIVNSQNKITNKADYFNEQLPPDQSELSCNWTNRKFV